jgi:hypothetical protein
METAPGAMPAWSLRRWWIAGRGARRLHYSRGFGPIPGRFAILEGE